VGGDSVNFKGFGKLIKSAREEAGLTQLELAEMADLSRSYIADVEAGRYTPSLKTSITLSKILSINLNQLTSGTEIQV
jgi:DNA-binding XRE family transcriptional regulator